MRTKIKVQDPGSVMLDLTITMTLNGFILLRNQLDSVKQFYAHPACDLKNLLDKLLETISATTLADYDSEEK